MFVHCLCDAQGGGGDAENHRRHVLRKVTMAETREEHKWSGTHGRKPRSSDEVPHEGDGPKSGCTNQVCVETTLADMQVDTPSSERPLTRHVTLDDVESEENLLRTIGMACSLLRRSAEAKRRLTIVRQMGSATLHLCWPRASTFGLASFCEVLVFFTCRSVRKNSVIGCGLQCPCLVLNLRHSWSLLEITVSSFHKLKPRDTSKGCALDGLPLTS